MKLVHKYIRRNFCQTFINMRARIKVDKPADDDGGFPACSNISQGSVHWRSTSGSLNQKAGNSLAPGFLSTIAINPFHSQQVFDKVRGIPANTNIYHLDYEQPVFRTAMNYPAPLVRRSHPWRVTGRSSITSLDKVIPATPAPKTTGSH